MAIEKSGYKFKCDHPHCTETATFSANILIAEKEARDKGWSVAKNRKVCWCPQHAWQHGNVSAVATKLIKRVIC